MMFSKVIKDLNDSKIRDAVLKVNIDGKLYDIYHVEIIDRDSFCRKNEIILSNNL
jgi:hypothetical protein